MTINSWYFSFRNAISHHFPRMYHILDKYKSVVKFLVSGTISGTSDLILLFLFHGRFGLEIILSTSISFILAFMISFSLQKLWTFRNNDKKNTGRQLVLYFVVALIALNINGFLMHLLVNRLHWNYLLSQLLVNFAIGLNNFIVYKLIIFKNRYEVDNAKTTTKSKS